MATNVKLEAVATPPDLSMTRINPEAPHEGPITRMSVSFQRRTGPKMTSSRITAPDMDPRLFPVIWMGVSEELLVGT